MRKLILISTLGTLAGYAVVHFAFFAKPAPVPQTPVVSAPAEPVVLAHVVEVTDTDPLLDPLPGQSVGLPFDTEPDAPVNRLHDYYGGYSGPIGAGVKSFVPAAGTPIPHAAD